MTLIKSISGIRGTIGGRAGDTLNPLDIVKFTSAYATLIRRGRKSGNNRIVVGRDARISGEMVRSVVCGTLMGMGYEVVDIGLATTPTTELAVRWLEADGGIIITASHNPRQWNALKLLNAEGEFLNKEEGEQVLKIAAEEDFEYADVDHVGHYIEDNSMNKRHIESVLALDLVDAEAVKSAGFRVVVDGINSVGGIILPDLLCALGVECKVLNGEATGNFAHNPEPLRQNLSGIMDEIKKGGYDMGIVVDPDVDRLAFICEDGEMFGEEYTLVSVADYVLGNERTGKKGEGLVTVSNLSSTRALRDITEKRGGKYFASAVGEVNVTTLMKQVGAVIGGEGNGGVIYPASHYGRDALVGIALFLTHLAGKTTTDANGNSRRMKVSELRASYPTYFMAKNRIDLQPSTDVDAILSGVKQAYEGREETFNGNTSKATVCDIDGVKIDFADRWVHLRKSNTEPIIRVYSEAPTAEEAEALAEQIRQLIKE